MKHPTSRSLYGYWNRRRGEHRAPSRCDIEPFDIGADLVDLFLIHMHEGVATFRFCGSSVATAYGRDLTGEDFVALWSPEERGTVRGHLDAMAARSAGFVAGVVAETAGGGFTSYELMLLPLAGEDRCDRAIGCMVRIGGHRSGNAANARIVSQALRSVRFLTEPAQEPLLRPVRRVVPPPPAGESQARRRYRHLVVVSGGK